MIRTILPLLLILPLLVGPGSAVAAGGDQEVKLAEVIEVLEQIGRIPEKSIPRALLENAQGIAVIPKVIKLGLVIGGRYGKGVVLVRKPDGTWSGPAFVSLTGGSVGWQIGAQSTDVILVFKSRKGVQKIAAGKLTIGAGASVAAGPVGRHTGAATDIGLGAEIYAYSRSRGLFAGISLDGASLKMQPADNIAYYRRPDVTPERIFAGDIGALPDSARQLQGKLQEMTE